MDLKLLQYYTMATFRKIAVDLARRTQRFTYVLRMVRPPGFKRTVVPRIPVVRVVPPTARYSVQKFLELHDYIGTTSLWRVLWIIVVTPLPGLISAIIPALIPLQALRYGPGAAFFAHVFCLMVAITCGSTIPVISFTGIPSNAYSLREAVVVSVCTGLFHITLISLLTRWWSFPIPFMWVCGTMIWSLSVVLAHLIVLRSKCWRETVIMDSVRRNYNALSLEVIQIVLYPAMSILFDHVSETYQVLITLSFPVVKYLLKAGIRHFSLHLHEHHAVLVVAGVEICASLYQSMIMQTAPSTVAIVIIMTLDVVQGLAAIKFSLDRHPTTDVSRRDLVATAFNTLRSRQETSSQIGQSSSPASILPVPTDTQRPRLDKSMSTHLLPQKTDLRVDNSVVYRALQFTHASETIVLLEYFEVIVPILNSLFLITAAQFHGAAYNTRIAPFYHNPHKLLGAIGSILMYSLLQGVSWGVLHLVMKYRYGVSATYHLAFTLERHRIPIQAKMAAWLPIILHFTTVHYGTDFSFQFDFKSWEQW